MFLSISVQGSEDGCELVSVVASQLDFIQILSQCGVELQAATPLERHSMLNKALSLVSGRAKRNGLQFSVGFTGRKLC